MTHVSTPISCAKHTDMFSCPRQKSIMWFENKLQCPKGQRTWVVNTEQISFSWTGKTCHDVSVFHNVSNHRTGNYFLQEQKYSTTHTFLCHIYTLGSSCLLCLTSLLKRSTIKCCTAILKEPATERRHKDNFLSRRGNIRGSQTVAEVWSSSSQ